MRCFGNFLSRRNFLTVGAVGGLGLSLGDFFRMRSLMADQKNYDFIPAKAESVIHIFLPGGMAHQETFDPKPYSPLEYRGEMGVTKTNTGEIVSEVLPHLAAVADKFTIIRSMTHGEAAHERGTHNMFTGYKPSPALIYPSFGSVISHEYGPRNNLPPYVCIPNRPNEFAGSGYLSSSYGPFSLGVRSGQQWIQSSRPRPAWRSRWRTICPSSQRPGSSQPALCRSSHNADTVGAMDTFYERAYSLISSEKARAAFNIEAEDAAMRDRYGRNAAGQRLLMARRLVEAGCSLRHADLRWLGHARADHATASAIRCRRWIKRSAHCCKILTNAGCSTRRWSWSAASLVAHRRSTTMPVAITGLKSSALLLAGGGIKRGTIYGSSRSDRIGTRTRCRDAGRPGDHDVSPVGHCGRQGIDGSG